ncbi:hypothetical protein NL676_009767 [Syzygium grande]|nr:hypothetical protein NL676_009767 [Syzygium grande]
MHGLQFSRYEVGLYFDYGRSLLRFSAPEDEDDAHQDLLRRKIGNGLPDSVLDWTREVDSEMSCQNNNNQVFFKKALVFAPLIFLLVTGLRIFEELVEVNYLARSCGRAMKAVGVVEATCEEIFQLVMRMDGTRWDSSFQDGSLVEEVDGHTAILYHRLQLGWFPMLVWPRDLCYVRYWRRNDDGSYVVLFRSREHVNCGPQPGCVRAHVESGGFNISPLKSRNGRPRTQVQHLMQIDLKGWGVGYIPAFQQQCLLHLLNCVAGMREWFAQTDDRSALPRIPVMVNMTSASVSSYKAKHDESTVHPTPSLETIASGRNSVMMDEDSDEDEEFQEQEEYSTGLEGEVKKEEEATEEEAVEEIDLSSFSAMEEEAAEQIDLSCFSGNLPHVDHDNARDCWRISDGNNFRVRSKQFFDDQSEIPAGNHLMDLVAVDWFKDTKIINHVARRKGCAAQVASRKGLFSIVINVQVPGSTHYSMVFYFITKKLEPGSLLQRFVDGNDEFRNKRLKLIPSVPKGSWIVQQSVGSAPCLLGKAVDCNYIRGPNYLEIDVNIDSSTVVKGVWMLVNAVIKTLAVDMAFLVQANTADELPERLMGAVRVSHIELSSAIVPDLDAESS